MREKKRIDQFQNSDVLYIYDKKEDDISFMDLGNKSMI
jgi:hypothetical protein